MVTLTRGQYDALISAGLTGDTDAIKSLRDTIDDANSITRYRLQIRWQNATGSPATRIQIGLGWPPEQTYLLELERAIAREDVDSVLAANANNPVTVMVTPDPEGLVGWTLLADYDFSSAT